MDTRPLFLTGVARGGTTLVGQVLGAHSAIELAIEPMLPIYRSWRNAICRGSDIGDERPELDPAAPLQDAYFNRDNLAVLQKLLAADLVLPIDRAEWPNLIDGVAQRAQHEAADIVDDLKHVTAPDTYRSLFAAVLETMAKHRGDSDTRWVGSKDVWIIDFFPALARSFPAAKFIVVVRDPRAVIASNEVARGQSDYGHPLSYARHWRKLVALSSHFAEDPLLAGRLLVLRYEALARNPESEAQGLCRFLELDFDPAMLDPRQYRDRATGGTWSSNSNFVSTIGIDPNAADRWKKKITPPLARLVDFVCGPEMGLVGYVPECDPVGLPLDPLVLAYLLESNDESFNWRSDARDPQLDLGNEAVRLALLASETPCPDKPLVRQNFLMYDVYERLWQQYGGQRTRKPETRTAEAT